MKKLFCGLLLVSVIIGGTFALLKDKVFVEVPDDVRNNLELRYGEKFEFLGYIKDENTENARVMRLKGKSGVFKLTRYYDKDGYLHYNDTYFAIKHKNEIEKIFNDAFRGVDRKIKYEIDFDESTFPNETTSNLSLPDFLRNDDTVFKINAVSAPRWVDNDIEIFTERLFNSGTKASVSLLHCGDKLIDLNDFDSVIRSSDSDGKRLFFSTDSNGGIFYINRE